MLSENIRAIRKAKGLSQEELARALWESLNEDNKVSLFVRYIALEDGAHQTVIINKHGEGNHGTQS